jgi:flavorubredoxin
MACSRIKFTFNLVKSLREDNLDPFLQQARRFVAHVLAPARRYILSASEEIQKDREKEKIEKRIAGRQ